MLSDVETIVWMGQEISNADNHGQDSTPNGTGNREKWSQTSEGGPAGSHVAPVTDTPMSKGRTGRQIAPHRRRPQCTSLEKYGLHPSAHFKSTHEKDGVGRDRALAMATRGVKV